MNQNQPHARAFDLPGWPSPPRVRDIPRHERSWGWGWGWISISAIDSGDTPALAQDELGYLWVNGASIPQFRLPTENWDDPGALVFWTETGIGLWVHPKSLKVMQSISRLDMDPDAWPPVNEVAAEWPTFIKEAS